MDEVQTQPDLQLVEDYEYIDPDGNRYHVTRWADANGVIVVSNEQRIFS